MEFECNHSGWGLHVDGSKAVKCLSSCWPSDHGQQYLPVEPASESPDSLWRYGCWFFQARGTGAFVNIGHRLVARSLDSLMAS